MKPLHPMLWFNTQAQEAANFYCGIFPHSKVKRVTKYPESFPDPPTDVVTVEFELNGQQFVALNGGPNFTFTEAVSFVISCDTQEDIDYYWSRLTAEGGQESQCGWLKDRFGLSWQVVPSKMGEYLGGDPARAARVMAAFMPMKKFDIATIEKAAKG